MAKWLKVAGLAVVALLVAASASGDSNTYNYQTSGGVNFNTKNGAVVDASGNAKVADADRDRDLDYYATVIATASLDTAASLWSAPIDLRKYSRFTVIVHITPGVGAADTTYAGLYDFGLTMYAPPVLAIDWTGYGMPIVTRGSGGRTATAFATTQADTTAGFFATPTGGAYIYDPSVLTTPGERFIRLRGAAYLAYANRNYINRYATQTVRIPGSDLLGPGDRPRFAVFQLRGMKRASTNAPSVRVDIEALR